MINSFFDETCSIAEKTARSLLRDFSEIENLQISEVGVTTFAERAYQRIQQRLIDSLLLLSDLPFDTKAPDRWSIRPIDGYENFVHGFFGFSVSIALVLDNITEFVIVYCPLTRSMFSAKRGCIAVCNANEIHVSTRSKISIIVTDRYSSRIDIQPQLRMIGNNSLSCCYVSAGKADIGIIHDMWHPAILLLEAAGAIITQIDDFFLVGSYISINSFMKQ